jgi:hypothetical protein
MMRENSANRKSMGEISRPDLNSSFLRASDLNSSVLHERDNSIKRIKADQAEKAIRLH